MNLPGFNAEASLSKQTTYRHLEGPSAGNLPMSIVPQQGFNCFAACQNSWSGCLSSCALWEWLTGWCVPKCRLFWIDCVRRC